MPQLAYLAGCLAFLRSSACCCRCTSCSPPRGDPLLLAGLLAARSLPGVFVLYGLSGFLIALFWPPLYGVAVPGLEEQALNRTRATST